MPEQIIAVIYPVFLIALSIFLVYRLKMRRARDVEGLGLIYTGLFLILISSLANLLQHQPDYPTWFIGDVYTVIPIAEFLLLAGGIILFLIGLVLYFSYWGDRDQEVANHLEKLRLLDNLQQENRYPSPVPELLDRVLRGMLSGLDEEAGAIFLLNRSQKKFVLVTASGLTKDEISLLEYYPYGRNIVTQTVEDETPMISSDFRSLGGKAQLAASKFRSILVVPLISGRSRVGALLFFSQEEKHYSREFISIISPVGEWLSEKIEANRLSRDLKKSNIMLEDRERQLNGLFNRLGRLVSFVSGIPDPSEFADKCIGLAGADEIWLLGLTNGRLIFHGGSAATADFSDNFKTAVINALSKNKPLILNQEGTDENGNAFIARSALLLPAAGHGNAVLLRNNRGPISITNEELKVLEVIAGVAGMVISSATSKSADFSRSKGLEAVTGILRLQISLTRPEKDIAVFMAGIGKNLSRDFLLMLFKRDMDRFRVSYADIGGEVPEGISIAAGEASTGKAAVLRSDSVLFSRQSVLDNLAEYDEENRNALHRLFGDRKTPAFQGDYPIIINNQVEFVATLYGFGDSPAHNLDQHRLISLLIALLNLRMDIASARQPRILREKAGAGGLTEEQINDINNSLYAISGYCQLARRNSNLSGATAGTFDSILQLTEDLAVRFKQFVSRKREPQKEIEGLVNIRNVIEEIFDGNIISGNLHMIEGRPFAVNLKLQDFPALDISRSDFTRFMNDACRAFTENVDADEIISIGAYPRKGFLYIDISRHRENFPPVEPVAGFGNYRTPEQITDRLKNTEIIRLLESFSGELALDRYSRTPSYFSFRLPLREKITSARPGISGETLTIMAVDDQAVILDLLAAMCQSLGYKILTARSGEEGLQVFENYRPDIVVSDLAMPGLSGWELSARIKSVSPETPVILITGWGVPINEEKMKETGVDYILHKPFRLEELSELISKVKFSRIST